MHGNFDNTLKLVRLVLRRERFNSSVWIIVLTLFSVILAPGMHEMFSDMGTRTQIAAIYDNPIMVAMMGPVYGLDNFTTGAMYGGMMLLWVAIAVGVMNIFLVTRHTRTDEERGQIEVVRSLPVGRLATINAAMISALLINGVLALLIGLGLAATGTDGMGLGSSLLYGALVGAVGLVFAAITALCCQLSSSSGGAIGMSMGVLGLAYMIRAAGDAQGSDLIACMSPFGLAQRSQVYVNDYLWPLLVLLALACVIAAIAFKLNSIRDLGQGFLAAKPGRRGAGPLLRSPFGLAVRLLAKMLIIWFVVMLMLGASYGSVIADIGAFVGDSPEYLQVIGIPAEVVATMTDADKSKIIVDYFAAFITVMMTLVCLVPVLNAAMRVRSEEREGRSEHILSRVVSNTSYMAGYVAIAYIASVLIQFATAAGLYLATDAMAEANPFTFGGLVSAFFAYLPAMWVLIGVAVLIIGLFPKATGAIWAVYGFVAFTSFIGGMLKLPDWVNWLSPMYHVPRLPMEEMAYPPLVVMTVIALVLTALGFVFYKRRDLAPA
ncbi:MAG: ABC transporter permease [Eggerthellaceae bacterium]|nr:ABC transporter permease [Eggerthellaceae bacterium]MDR2715333.1 ABC transporter permease [Coriobacteriaceae bacterium]